MAKTTSTDRATPWLRWIARIWAKIVLGVALLVFLGYAVEWLQNGVADPYAAEEYPFTENPGYIVPYLMSLIVSVPGILFLVCWQRSRKHTASAKEA